MRLFQGLLFLFFGVGLLLVAYQSLARGWLPFGSRGLSGRLEFRRSENPFLYWLAFALYIAAGLALAIYSIRVLAGIAPLLKLR
jgi:hypothetical protein